MDASVDRCMQQKMCPNKHFNFQANLGKEGLETIFQSSLVSDVTVGYISPDRASVLFIHDGVYI